MSHVHYRVAMVNQQYSPVCWLACAVMVIQFKRGYTPTTAALGQSPDFRLAGLTVAADHVSSGVEECARLRQLGFTVTESSHLRDPQLHSMAPPRPGQALLQTSGPSEDVILWLLHNHGPFILRHYTNSFWYGPDRHAHARAGHRPGKHSVVITGIDTERHCVTFNNPWGDTDVPTTASSIVGAIRRFEAAHHEPFAYL